MSRSAHEFGPDDLVLSFCCLRFVSFDERVAAAAQAGFDGFGLFWSDYQQLREQGRSDDELRGIVDEYDQVLAEIEVIGGWAGNAAARAAADEQIDLACQMARTFGSRQLQVIGPFEGSLDDAADAFGRLCDRCAEVDLQVGLEFLPFQNIPDAGIALEIVERAGRRNGGLCVDSWHHFRGARNDALLRAVPGERVVSIQLNDGTLEPEDPEDYVRDCLAHRRLAGDGEFDLSGFVGILDDIGAMGPRSVEIISDELGKLPAAEAAEQMLLNIRKLVPRRTRGN